MPTESTPPQAHGEDEEIPLPEAPNPRTSTLVKVALVLSTLLVGLFLAGLLPRIHRDRTLGEESAKSSRFVPTVNAARPKRRTMTGDVTLPGSVQALLETNVFARTSGYVKRRLVDIGDHVEEGQLLVELETPELRQELLQAQATIAQSQASLEQAKTSLEFSRTSLERYKALVPAGIASQQDLDQRQSAFSAASASVRASEAAINSNQANVRRLMELQSFARVTAPFAGTITTRMIEVGALVTSGNGAGQALYKIAQLDPVRVMVSVPQTYAPLMRVGAKAKVGVREFVGRDFTGKITRTSGALDPVSRTMLVEVQIPNKDGALLSGMYAQMKLDVAEVEPPLLVPVSAMILTAEGTQVAVISADHRAHMRKVVVEGDYGLEVGIASGLGAEELVITNPGERLSEGIEVTVAAPPQVASAAPQVTSAAPPVTSAAPPK